MLKLWTTLLTSPSFLATNNNDHSAPSLISSSTMMQITSLSRYAIKGLSGDNLQSVHIGEAMDTFPDDRRYALLKQSSSREFNVHDPKCWVHKEHFLCAFTAPKLMASYQSEYQIINASSNSSWGFPCDSFGDHNTSASECDQDGGANSTGSTTTTLTQRILTLYQRPKKDYPTPVLGPIHLETSQGREELASFFSMKSNQALTCVTHQPQQQQGDENDSSSISLKQQPQQNRHQFGNTRSGIKYAKDTRTIHIINAATVRQFSNAIGIPLDPMRFRPNIIVDGWEPWKEFDCIGKILTCRPHGRGTSAPTASDVHTTGEDNKGGINVTNTNTLETKTVELKIISRTVRCAGVGVDPLDPPDQNVVLDIPKLLNQHFPQHGPYLGVYAVIRTPGELCVGDVLTVVE